MGSWKGGSRYNRLGGVVILIVFLVAGLAFGQRTMRLASQARSLPAARLYFLTTTGGVRADKTVQVMIDPRGQPISFARVEVDFDPGRIKLVTEVEPATRLGTLIQKSPKWEANTTGRIIIVQGLSPESMTRPPMSPFSLASLKFAPVVKLAGVTRLTFAASGEQIVDLQANNLPYTSHFLNLQFE